MIARPKERLILSHCHIRTSKIGKRPSGVTDCPRSLPELTPPVARKECRLFVSRSVRANAGSGKLNACSLGSEDTTAEWHQRTTAMVRDLLMARPLTMNGSYGVPGSGHGELFGPSASMLSLPPASM